MKVILLQDVKKLGKKDDVIEVSEGYARNFILPKKLGVEANVANMNQLKRHQADEAKKAQDEEDNAKEFAKELSEIEVVVKMKGGEGGRVFGSVSTKEIVQAVKEQHNIEIDKKKVILPESIKAFGYYEITVKLHPRVTGTLKVRVEENG